MPVITVSRQEGSQGEDLARLIAEQLGFAFVDRDAIVKTAQDLGIKINKALVPEIDETKPSFWERLDEERRRYNLLLRHLVYEFAERDRCVILGHGSEAYLAALNNVLKVKVIAPFETRMKRVMEQRKLSKEAATQALRQKDRQFAGYHKYLFNTDWLNPELYDLVVNTQLMPLETALAVIVAAIQAPSMSPTPQAVETLADRALVCRVEMRLLLDPRIGTTGLRVTASRGEVTLSGTLATDEEKEVAELVASETPGIRRLLSELVVVPITSTLYP